MEEQLDNAWEMTFSSEHDLFEMTNALQSPESFDLARLQSNN
jgi:hypothetical protein